jgi:hypothetical protein
MGPSINLLLPPEVTQLCSMRLILQEEKVSWDILLKNKGASVI